jgi:DNA polymerase III subunit chi
MADNADTSASVVSSEERRSPPGWSAAGPGEASTALRVDFYVLQEASASARLKLACRLAEKAYLAAQSALVWHNDPVELKTFDELLWTFTDGSFVPHDSLTVGAEEPHTPVLLSSGAGPSREVDILINLSTELPPWLAKTHRVAEIIDGDEGRRRAGRVRFKAYRDMGIQPATYIV